MRSTSPVEQTAQPTAPGRRVSATCILPAILLGLTGLTGYAWWATQGGLVRAGNWIGVDFDVYYLTARVLQRGGDIYHAGIAPPYVYPPLLAALLVPLAWLPVVPATILWKGFQHLCLLGTGVLLTSLVPWRMRPLAGGLLLLGLLTVPLHDEIQVGESNSLVLLLEVGALWLIVWRGAGRTWGGATLAAGGLLALAAGIKVLPLLLLAYFWGCGPRRVAQAATGAFLALQTLSWLVLPGTAEYWLVQLPSLLGQPFPFLDNQSLNAALARALLPTDPGLPSLQIVAAPGLRPILTWLANLAVLIAAAAVLWPRRVGTAAPAAPGPARATRRLLESGLVLLTIHLVSGSTWLHHLIDLAVPLCGLLSAWDPRPMTSTPPKPELRLRRILLWTGAFASAYILILVRPSDWVTLVATVLPGPGPAWLAGNTALGVVLGAWIVTARSLRREQGTRRNSVV